MKPVIILSFCLISNMGFCQMNLSLKNIDSLLQNDSSVIFDGLYPNAINASIEGIKKNKKKDVFGRPFKLIKYYNKKQTLIKEKIVYGKNDTRNYQVFFKDYSSIRVGVLYYCSGNLNDEKDSNGLPYGYPLTALMIQDKSSSTSYLVSYNYRDTIFLGSFKISKLYNLTIISLDRDFKVEFILSQCGHKAPYSVFSINNLKDPVKSNIEWDKLLDEPLGGFFNKRKKEIEAARKFSPLKDYPMYDWEGNLFCRGRPEQE